MKKQLLAAAALALVSGVAAAQSATVYGIIDTGVYTTNNGSSTGQSVTKMASGTWLPSLFGIKGSEDLGGGLKANFNLQGDLGTTNGTGGGTVDSTAYSPAASLFDRYATVGLSGSLGAVDIGRQIDNMFLQSFLNGVIPTHTNSLAVNGLLAYANTNTNSSTAGAFLNNTIGYTSPTINGVTVKAQYTLSGQSGSTSQGSQSNVVATYAAANGLALSAGYEQVKNVLATAAANSTTPAVYGNNTLTKGLIGAKYTVGLVDLAAQWNSFKTDGSPTTDGYEVGAAYHFTPATVVGVNYETFKTSGASDRNIVSLKAKYDLSKRTAIWGLVSSYNSAAAANMAQGYALVTGSASTATGFGVGVTHQF